MQVRKAVERLSYKLKRAVFKMSPSYAERRNFEFRMRGVPNRDFLEQAILGYVNRTPQVAARPKRCLFVGLDKYNWHYHRKMEVEFHTIDFDAENAVYGRPGRHVTGCVKQLTSYYDSGFFDVIINNGLVGYGIDNATDFARMMQECHAALAPGGELVLGFNDRPDKCDFPVRDSAALSLFEPFVPPIAGVSDVVHKFEDASQHIYLFLKKAA
jgi:SAM-dependent methyltransferase